MKIWSHKIVVFNDKTMQSTPSLRLEEKRLIKGNTE